MHLAILERKPAVLGLLLADLDAALLTEVVTAQLVTLDQERILPSKREEEETQRMFTVAGKKGASISVISCMETKVDWQPTFQWNAIHLAVKHDVPCLKVLLSLWSRGCPTRRSPLFSGGKTAKEDVFSIWPPPTPPPALRANCCLIVELM